MIYTKKQLDQVVNLIKKDKIGVIPTDTIYGIVTSAFNKSAVEKIYQLKKRNLKKPFIILISDISDLKKFNIKLNNSKEKLLNKFWPGPTSIILECNDQNFFYLHRDTNSLAFRLPNSTLILNILKKTGPLVAPSANLEGQKPSSNIKQAQNYFKDNIDFYLNAGELNNPPSKIINIKKDQIEILR